METTERSLNEESNDQFLSAEKKDESLSDESLSVNQRQRQIQELVGTQGFVSIEDLSNRFQVTPQTIRRDINRLSQYGLVHRHHGGASVPTSAENYAYTARKVLCYKEKARIARLLAKHIPDKASLFINIGTTTEEVAKVLLNTRCSSF